MLDQIVRYMPIIKFIKKNNIKSIAEIGSGSQGIGKFLKRKFTGVDFTTKDYGKIEQSTNKYMNFVQGSALDIPLKEDSFSIVFSTDMIEHIPQSSRAIAFKEMIRISKRDVVIAFPCGKLAQDFDASLFQDLKKKGKFVPGRLKEHVDVGIPTFEEIKKILDAIPGITWTYEWNSYISIRRIIIYISLYIRGGFLFLYLFGYIVDLFQISFNNDVSGYRLFVYIKKGK